MKKGSKEHMEAERKMEALAKKMKRRAARAKAARKAALKSEKKVECCVVKTLNTTNSGDA